MKRRTRIPAIEIRIPLEGEPEVLRRDDDDEWKRLRDWLLAKPRVLAIVLAAGEALAADDVARDDDDVLDEVEGVDQDDGVAFLFGDYAAWPRLAMQDLVPVPIAWLRERGIEVDDEGRVESWDEERWPFDEGATPTDACFRPGKGWPPSVAEMENEL